MSSIPKTYAKELLKEYGVEYVNKDAVDYFIKEIDKFATRLAKNSNDCLKIRKGKKIMLKDVELASEYTE